MMQGSLAMRLRVLRAERGLSLTEAAERAGIQRQTLALLERGERHPHDPTLAKIAKGYGVPVEELLEEPALAAGKGEASRRTGWTEKGEWREEWLEKPYVEAWARYLEGQYDFLKRLLDKVLVDEDLSDDLIDLIALQTTDLCTIYDHDRVEERPEAKLGGETAKKLDRAAGEFRKLRERATRIAAQRESRASAREGFEDFSAGKLSEPDDTARAVFGR